MGDNDKVNSWGIPFKVSSKEKNLRGKSFLRKVKDTTILIRIALIPVISLGLFLLNKALDDSGDDW